jgi:hypothetical protein
VLIGDPPQAVTGRTVGLITLATLASWVPLVAAVSMLF